MRFINPYSGVVFDVTPRVMSNSHEHIYDSWYFKSAYEQGVRIFACVNYFPSAPSVSTKNLNTIGEMSNYSNWKTPVLDWENVDIPENVLSLPEEERMAYLTTRYYQNAIPTVNVVVDGVPKTINTKLIPQIANAEHAFHRWTQSDPLKECTHHNVLGNLFGEPTNGYGANILTETLYPGFDPEHTLASISAERTWRHNHMIFAMDELCPKYLAPENQQFDWKIFGTVNHTYDEQAETYFRLYPQVFKAMEMFNQFYSPNANVLFRELYDSLLRKGYKIFGTAAVDWIGDIETWNGLTPEERAEWTNDYNSLPDSEKSQYSSASAYYSAVVVKQSKVDRGFNMLYIDDYDEDSIDTLEKAMSVAEKGLEAYMSGRYYMTGTGTNHIESLVTFGNIVQIVVSGMPTSIFAVTSMRRIAGSGNAMSVKILPGETYIRFEAYYDTVPEGWNDMTRDEQKPYAKAGARDFLFTNPIWIEDNNLNDKRARTAFALNVI